MVASRPLRRVAAFLIRFMPWGILTLAGLGIVAAPLGLQCSFIERLAHMRFYWMAALSVLLIWWAVRKAVVPAILSCALLAAGLPVVWRYYRSGSAPVDAGKSGATLTVASWNVHSSNPKRQRGSVWLKDCQADVLLLTEINPGWAKHLKEISARWPHQICEPSNGAAGIWLLSFWPLTQVEAAGISPDEKRPWISCTVETPHGNVRVMGRHPRTPRGGHRFHERNVQLEHAAHFAAASSGPVVVLGDFNCTPFSP